MKMKNNAKLQEESTCQFKIDMSNLTNFDPNTRKSQKFPLQLAAFDQSIYAQAKKSIEELCLVALEIDAKTDLCFLKIFVYRLKNSDFILESKMAELN